MLEEKIRIHNYSNKLRDCWEKSWVRFSRDKRRMLHRGRNNHLRKHKREVHD